MTIQEAYEASALAKAVSEARLGHVCLEKDDAVMIHDTDYTNQPKSEAEKNEMGEWVRADHGAGSRRPASARGERPRRSQRWREGRQMLLHIGHLRGWARRT